MAEEREAESLRSIEELREESKISQVVFEGVKAACGWKTGKRMKAVEFGAAVQAFLSAPVDAREADKEAKG